VYIRLELSMSQQVFKMLCPRHLHTVPTLAGKSPRSLISNRPIRNVIVTAIPESQLITHALSRTCPTVRQ
jgi:hypothetical protein